MTFQSFSVKDRLPNEELLLTAYRLGFLKNSPRKKLLEDFTFYEFDLKELGFPSHEEILKRTNNLIASVPLQGWKSKGVEHKDYSGISLTYNPNYKGSETSIYHQTMGDLALSQSFARERGAENFVTKEDTYYDTFAFRKIPPIVNHYYKPLFEVTDCAISRSRIGVFYPKHFDPNKETGANWHKDEFPSDLFRINIPVITSKEHVLLIDGEDEYGNTLKLEKHLEVGKAYIWNTRIPHTVYAPPTAPPDARVHIVLGVLPYLSYNEEEDVFIANSIYGIPMKELIEGKMWCSKTK